MNKSIQGNANGIVEQAKQTVANVASDAKAGVTQQLEQRIDAGKGAAVEKIGTVSEAIRGAGEKLEGTGPLPDLAEKAADNIERLAQYFDNKTVGDLFRGVESFAKREPALFFGSALAVGILAGRFLKSSGHRTSDSSRYAYAGGDIGTDRYEAFGDEGTDFYGSEGDYLSADDLEDDWENQPMAFESEDRGIGTDARTTQPQGSSFGSVGVGASSRGKTEKMPVTQGSIGGGTSASPSSSASSGDSASSGGSTDWGDFNKSNR